MDYAETEINRYSDSDYETVAGTWTGIKKKKISEWGYCGTPAIPGKSKSQRGLEEERETVSNQKYFAGILKLEN